MHPKDKSLTLRQLRYLIALDEERHFRRAAEQCGVSQPSLSAQIQQLEELLGAPLVERNKGALSLTPLGREVVIRASKVVGEVQDIIDLAAGSQHGLRGTLRLGTASTLGPYLLPFVTSKLHKEFPDLRLYVREALPRDLVSELSRGTYDVILSQLPVQGSELVAERLFREPLVLGYAADHPFVGRETISKSDLVDENVLLLNSHYRLHDQARDMCRTIGASLSRDYEGTSLDALRVMVGMGMGVTFFPALYVHSEVAPRSEVSVAKLKGSPLARSVGLIWRSSSSSSESFMRLADSIRDVVRRRFKDVILEQG
jgi:LysR family hydrogen peroxide-inducible transcriptional activator